MVILQCICLKTTRDLLFFKRSLKSLIENPIKTDIHIFGHVSDFLIDLKCHGKCLYSFHIAEHGKNIFFNLGPNFGKAFYMNLARRHISDNVLYVDGDIELVNMRDGLFDDVRSIFPNTSVFFPLQKGDCRHVMSSIQQQQKKERFPFHYWESMNDFDFAGGCFFILGHAFQTINWEEDAEKIDDFCYSCEVRRQRYKSVCIEEFTVFHPFKEVGNL